MNYCYDASAYNPSTASCQAGYVPYGKMRLTEVRNGTSSTRYTSYDLRGRITGYQQTTGGFGPYGFSGFSYNLAGALTGITYPSGRRITQTIDTAGRLSGITGYAPSILYAAQGAVQQITLGNNLVENWSYSSDRLQPTRMQLGTPASASSIGQLDWSYCGQAGVNTCATNNGNLMRETITAPKLSAALTRSFAYDGANRLRTAAEYSNGTATPTCPDFNSVWCQSYAYDPYANRTIQNRSGLTQPASEPTSFDGTTNRASGGYWLHDAAGNVTRDGAATVMGYDGENRLTSVNGWQYSYDGNGRRVYKVDGSGLRTIYVYAPDGGLAAEYSEEASSLGGTDYLTKDHLGSTRLITGSGGWSKQRTDYLPFGEELLVSSGSLRFGVPGYGSDAGVPQKFTGKERDAETGLDYFGARYYSAAQGRFTSADQPLADQHPEHPQSWNLYSYVRNNPLRLIDDGGRQSREATIGPLQDGQPNNRLYDVGVGALKSMARGGNELLRAMGADPNITDKIDQVLMNDNARQRLAGDVTDVAQAATGAKGILSDGLAIASMAKGSGPAKGVLEISAAYGSTAAVRSYSGKSTEFVFDAASSRFVMGNGKMKHRVLVDAAGIKDSNKTVGGMISRGENGKLVTNEMSGTYGRNWTDEIRTQFVEFMKKNGVDIQHH